MTSLDAALMVLSGFALTWLVILLVEFARLYATWCSTLESQIGQILDDRSLRSTLKRIAAAGGQGIYGPFVVILILCVARLSLFDNWTWPISLFVLLGLSVAAMVLAHVHLHNRATDLKDAGLERIPRGHRWTVTATVRTPKSA